MLLLPWSFGCGIMMRTVRWFFVVVVVWGFFVGWGLFCVFVCVCPGLYKNSWVTFVSIYQTAAGIISVIASPNQKGHLCQCSLPQSYAEDGCKILLPCRFVMLWCEHSLRCNLNSSFPSVCLSQHNSDYMSGWDAGVVPCFLCKAILIYRQ